MARGIEATVEIRIPFHDVDPAGVVWHGNYFRYFETARGALLDELDYGYRRMAESGFLWPVVDLSARFTRPITFDDVIRVRASLAEWEFRLKIDYELSDCEGKCLGRGQTVQVPVELDSRELVIGAPLALRERIEQKLADLAEKGGGDG